jgi:hypothetical protein
LAEVIYPLLEVRVFLGELLQLQFQLFLATPKDMILLLGTSTECKMVKNTELCMKNNQKFGYFEAF